MKYKNVLAIDPGGTTGLALRFEDGRVETAVAKTPEELYAFVKLVLNKLDAVVIENFIAETISHYGLYTVKLIGGIHALTYVYDVPFIIQNPQMRYPFRVEAQSLVKGKKTVIHERDALSHLLRWEHDNL